MAENEIKGEMIRGHVDTFILLSLLNGDKDSNEIKVAIEERSDNKFTVKQGTFYSAMQRLVKQNYIKEYRSSASDGIRRKYYSLTEKGKKSLDKNREEWNKSKELIDNLIETPGAEPQPERKLPEVKADEFDEFKKFADQNAADYTFYAPDNSDDSYLDRLGSEVLDDLNTELDSIKPEETEIEAENETEKPEESVSSVYDEILPPDDDELITDASDDEISDDVPSDGSLKVDEADETDIPTEENIVYDFELPDANNYNEASETTDNEDFNHTENIVKSQVISEDLSNEDNADESLDQQVKTVNASPEKEVSDEKNHNGIDDTLFVEEGSPTNRREYKSILGKLFPKLQNEETANDNATEERKPEESKKDRQIDFDEYIADEYDDSEVNANDKPSHTESADKRGYGQGTTAYSSESGLPIEDQSAKQGDYDFSDLYKMAKTEGFKVRTSLSTNEFNGNGIFVNKLNLHSSLLFYGLLLIEVLVLNFALSGILGWSFAAKAVIAGVPALLPIAMLVIYLITPNRKVREISGFKDVITVFLIITFQLVIVDLCVALFMEVDFNNAKEVLSYIVVPFILLINIPLFPIVKYSLLGTGRYFDETHSEK